MTLDALIGLAVMVVFTILVLVNMIRSTRRLHRARPEVSEPTRRFVMPPPRARAPGRSAQTVAAPARRAAPPKRRPAPPTLEARFLRNRRLSPGARLVVASEILSPPKSLRRRP